MTIEAMTIEAYVENGQIVLPGPLELPNGTKVQVSVGSKLEATDLRTTDLRATEAKRKTINERLSNVIGQAQGLPADFAENHDHYLHGTAKKTE